MESDSAARSTLLKSGKLCTLSTLQTWLRVAYAQRTNAPGLLKSPGASANEDCFVFVGSDQLATHLASAKQRQRGDQGEDAVLRCDWGNSLRDRYQPNIVEVYLTWRGASHYD